MKKLFYLSMIFFTSFGVLSVSKSSAQGCVAIRSTGGMSCDMHHPNDTTSKWQFAVNNRYYNSYKHFVGTEEQKQRQELGNQVVNHGYTMDLALTYEINKRWSVFLDVPVIANSRSSLYEHQNVGRYVTHSFGVGDIRFAAYSWLWNPAKNHKGNVQVGLGLKLPTGNYEYEDYFQTTDSTKILGPVDQSIQLGDGGTGITLEINAYYNISHTVNFYGNFYYLSNPREQNGVSTARGGTPSPRAIANGSDVMSVPDQYMARAGANFNVRNWTFSAGVRQECLPVYDLIGGSNAFRRPGYIISGEPGISLKLNKVVLYTFVPVAIVRNRTQSVPDKITTEQTGKYTHGDAAFADYVLNIGAIIRF